MGTLTLPKVDATKLSSFAGGLNLRDSISELAPDETPKCMNVTLKQRGGAVKRLGHTKKNGSAALAAASKQGFYWKSKDHLVVQVGTGLYKTTDFTSWTLIHTFSDSGLIGLCEFNTQLVGVHPTDGVFTYDDAAFAIVAASVKGSTIAAWQNKLWVGDSTGTLWWSNAGNASVWTVASDFNKIWDVNTRAITAVGAGQGQDILGRPTLYVWKGDAFHRVYDSSNGAYTTIDSSHGASSPLAVASLYGTTVVVSRDGLFAVKGDVLIPVAQKINPMWQDGLLNLDRLDLASAGVHGDRMFFSLPLAGASVNGIEVEYHPVDGWAVTHDYPAAWYATYDKTGIELLKGHPSNDYVYQAFSGGSDDGAAIAMRFRTSRVSPYSGYRAAFHRGRMKGRGTNVSAYAILDDEAGQGELQTYSIDLGGFTWNSFNWNDGSLWGPASYIADGDLWRLGVGKSLAVEFVESSSLTTTAPQMLDMGTGPTEGGWALYELTFEHSQRGRR